MKKKVLIYSIIGLLVIVGIVFCNYLSKHKSNDSKNEIIQTIKKYEKSIDNTMFKLDIPNDWNYEELEKNEENDFYKFALKIYKSNKDKYAVLYLYRQSFGVCGTGRIDEQIKLNNGNKATIGYYNDNEVWQDISFYEQNDNIVIINYGLDINESKELLNFIKTIDINEEKEISLSLKEETLTSMGATFILKNNSNKEYDYGADYYIEYKHNDNWNEIQLDEPLSWNSIAYVIKPGDEQEININWSYGYGELKTGIYRLVKKVSKVDDKPIDESKIIYLYSEFEIR